MPFYTHLIPVTHLDLTATRHFSNTPQSSGAAEKSVDNIGV